MVYLHSRKAHTSFCDLGFEMGEVLCAQTKIDVRDRLKLKRSQTMEISTAAHTLIKEFISGIFLQIPALMLGQK
jgi:hypothetical protein